jgi:hypothetical protein
MNRALILLLTLVSTVLASDPPPLRRADAQHLLEIMEWREVNIVTVQQGINNKGVVAPIYATIVAVATRDSKHQQVFQNVYYDEERGWFFYELTNQGARVWCKDGYKEIKPWNTW